VKTKAVAWPLLLRLTFYTQKSALSSRILQTHHKQSKTILNFLCTLYCAFYYTNKHTNSHNPAHQVYCYKLWESYNADCNQFDSIRKWNERLSVLLNAHNSKVRPLLHKCQQSCWRHHLFIYVTI